MGSSVDVRNPAPKVFEYISDPENQVVWTPNFLELLEGPDRPPGIGMKYKGRLKAFGAVNFVVDKYEPGTMFRVDTDPKLGRLTHQFVVTGEGTTCTIDHLVELHPRGAYRVAGPALKFLIRRMIADLDKQMHSVLSAI